MMSTIPEKIHIRQCLNLDNINYRVYEYAESMLIFHQCEAQLKISNLPIIHTRKVYGRPIISTRGR